MFYAGGRALDPTQDAVYAFLKRFMVEAASLFPDPAINFCGAETQFLTSFLILKRSFAKTGSGQMQEKLTKRRSAGDELQFACLDSNPKIRAWAAARNMSVSPIGLTPPAPAPDRLLKQRSMTVQTL